MARKKLSALAIPKLTPGEWYDAVVPGLILRVGAKRRTWTYPLSRRRLLSPRAARPFPGDGAWPRRVTPRGKVIERARQRRATDGTGTASALGRCADAGRAARPLRGDARCGKASGSRRCRRRCGCCGVTSSPIWRCRPPVLQGRPARGARSPGRGRHRGRSQPPAGRARPGDALGGRGRSDPGQLRSGHPPHASEQARARADQAGNRGDLESLRAISARREVAQELRPHGALPAADGTAARRGRIAPPRSHPRRRLAADREQGEPAAQPRRCRRWRWRWSGKARRGTTFSAAAARQDRRVLQIETRARRGVRRRPTGGCTICAEPRPPTCRSSASATRSCRRSSTTRCPASAASICEAELEKQKAEALATWAAALTRIVGPVRVTA